MTSSYAQSNKLKIILDESGETYVKGFVRGQFWARYLIWIQELVLIVKREQVRYFYSKIANGSFGSA
jgi:hypothetical protein